LLHVNRYRNPFFIVIIIAAAAESPMRSLKGPQTREGEREIERRIRDNSNNITGTQKGNLICDRCGSDGELGIVGTSGEGARTCCLC